MRYQVVPLALVTFLSVVSAAPSPQKGWWHQSNHRGSKEQGAGGSGFEEPSSSSLSAAPAESSLAYGGSSTGGSTTGSSTTGGTNTEGSTNGGTSGTESPPASDGSSSSNSSSTDTSSTLSGPSTSSNTTTGATLSTKKGTGTWLATMLDVSWAYDWTDHPDDSYKGPSTIDIVPLIDTNSDFKALAASSYKEILGYNEPEIPGLNGNGTVAVSTAISQWPDVVATGKRIGSPAPGVAKVYDGDWLDQFMTGIAQAGSHVDFIALHYYTPDGNLANFQSYIEAQYAKYKLPIWVTEFGYVDYSMTPPKQPDYDTQIAYMQKAVPMLNSLSYVERFLWCDVPNSGTGEYENGALTSLGEAYKAL